MHLLNHIQIKHLRLLLARYGLTLHIVDSQQDIPYSFWGAPEAGRHLATLYARHDTPVHSLLHEMCHYICMSATQREEDSYDAGGSALTENSCCYLQLLLSSYIPDFNLAIHLHDMNSWGYHFRLGSASRWFSADSDDARQWLLKQNIITEDQTPTWRLRAE